MVKLAQQFVLLYFEYQRQVNQNAEPEKNAVPNDHTLAISAGSYSSWVVCTCTSTYHFDN